jgi:hypothetical protein
MKYKLKLIFVFLILLSSQLAKSDERVSLVTIYGDVLIYRPIGFALTVTGTALFVAITPMLAIANLAPPHDAFDDSSEMLVMTPFNFTFNRPLGAMWRDGNGVYQRR